MKYPIVTKKQVVIKTAVFENLLCKVLNVLNIVIK